MIEENNKKKNSSIGIIILLIIVILALSGYIAYDKNLIFNKAEEKEQPTEHIEDEDIDIEENKTEEETIKNCECTSQVYASSDDKYLLILSKYDRNWLNQNNNSPFQVFSLSVDNGQGVDEANGHYTMNENQLELFTNDPGLTILNGTGATVTETEYKQYRINLEISNDKITIGNVELYLK